MYFVQAFDYNNIFIAYMYVCIFYILANDKEGVYNNVDFVLNIMLTCFSPLIRVVVA